MLAFTANTTSQQIPLPQQQQVISSAQHPAQHQHQQQFQQQPQPSGSAVYVGSQRFYANLQQQQQKSAQSNTQLSASGGETSGVGVANGVPVNPKVMYRDLKRKFKYLVYVSFLK